MTPVSMGCSGYSNAQAISPQGDVVGYFACGASEDLSFVSWGGDSLTPLVLRNQYWSRAYDINTNQHIAGTVEILGEGIRAYLFMNGQAANLGVLPNHDTSEAFGLNASEVVVGYSANTQVGPAIACRWIKGGIDPLSLPNGPDANANDINDNGQIVGWMGSYPAGAFPAEAFLWDSGTVTPLGMPEGATNSTANAISNTGIICGYYSYPNSQGPGGYARRALAWIDGSMTDLGVLPGFVQSMAFDVNDASEIVGYCSNPPLLGNGRKAFVWRNGVMTALDSVLAPESPQYQIWYAYGINASGQIAATIYPGGPGGERAALLTPVPPLAGDTNCDWMVNTSDLLTVINGWGPCQKGTSCPGNLNDDDFVNVADLLMVINNWGS